VTWCRHWVLSEERRQQIAIDASDGVSVSADRLVLREAITNIVDNAIKYGPPGSAIDIRVCAERGQAVLTVADHGPGVAPEHRERVFDRFFRLDEARSRDDGGTGLGLAIARWAVEVNGGRIFVDAGATGGALIARGHWRESRRFCCWTSRFRRSTRKRDARSTI
jgi:signal transduction histidine kinase